MRRERQGSFLEFHDTFLEFEVFLWASVDQHITEEKKIPLLVIIRLPGAHLHEVALFNKYSARG